MNLKEIKKKRQHRDMKLPPIVFVVLCSIFIDTIKTCTPNNDYSKILKLSLKFFRAQRTGRLPSDNDIPWRKDSFTTDEGDNGEDLSGGYFDAGMYISRVYNCEEYF